jgi:hypothetical protein
MNHNLETVPRLYKEARPGSDYAFSLNLLKKFKAHPAVPTKSGLMVGLGETDDEILQVMRDMRAHDIDMLTIGQYLAPSGHHLPVRATCTPTPSRCSSARPPRWASRTRRWARMVRSSYHADQQAHAAGVRVDLAARYNAVAGKAQGLGLVKKEDAHIEGYVTRKALDGLYFMIGEEEKKIRADPIGTGSALLRRVFGV